MKPPVARWPVRAARVPFERLDYISKSASRFKSMFVPFPKLHSTE
jgi:hypothetical protein